MKWRWFTGNSLLYYCRVLDLIKLNFGSMSTSVVLSWRYRCSNSPSSLSKLLPREPRFSPRWLLVFVLVQTQQSAAELTEPPPATVALCYTEMLIIARIGYVATIDFSQPFTPTPPPACLPPPITLTLPTSPQPLSSSWDWSSETAASKKTRNKKSRRNAHYLCCCVEKQIRERTLEAHRARYDASGPLYTVSIFFFLNTKL